MNVIMKHVSKKVVVCRGSAWSVSSHEYNDEVHSHGKEKTWRLRGEERIEDRKTRAPHEPHDQNGDIF